LPLLKIILSTITCLLLIATSKAGLQGQNIKSDRNAFADTIIKKDSPDQPINDPKQGFKDLFITSTLANGINAEQLNPLAISFVEDYIQKYSKTMKDMKTWGKPYFDMMDAILVQHGLPKELKYLAVIESQLKSNVRSWAGAVGPWQFMPATARNMGLRVSKHYDERTNYFKSTHAASRYLTGLFSIYGDWLLVIAAYNGGPGNVNSAIRKAGSNDFWALQNYLPAQSRNHVKKFIATHYIMEGGGGITTATKEEVRNLQFTNNIYPGKEEPDSSKLQSVSGHYNSIVIVKYVTMDIAVFNRMNPDFDKLIAVAGNYELRLPNDKMDIFLAKKFEILNESVQLLLNPVSNTNR